MKALSIWQPWAWLIAAGHKDIENRTWSPKFRGRIYVHASRRIDNDGAIWLWENRERLRIQACAREWIDICNSWKQSAIIGEVDIVDCVAESKSLWFTGPWGFVLANPKTYTNPISCKGQRWLFDVTDSLIAGSELRLESDRALF